MMKEQLEELRRELNMDCVCAWDMPGIREAILDYIRKLEQKNKELEYQFKRERLLMEDLVKHRKADEGLAYIASNAEPHTKSCEAHAQERDDMEDALTAALARIAEMEAALGRVKTWTHEHGAALCPPGADTYGEGKRDAKREVAGILSAALKGGK